MDFEIFENSLEFGKCSLEISSLKVVKDFDSEEIEEEPGVIEFLNKFGHVVDVLKAFLFLALFD